MALELNEYINRTTGIVNSAHAARGANLQDQFDCTGEIIDAANQMMNAGQKLTVDDMLEAEAAPRIPEHHPEREWQKQGLMINALAHAARWAASDAMDGSTPSADNAEASERGEEPEAPAQGEEVIIQALIDSLRPMLRTFLAQTRRKPRKLFVVCDGTIGSGKTTLLNEIEEDRPAGVVIHREPVEEKYEKTWWPLLTQFYHAMEELKKWQTKEAAQKAETATRALEHAIWNHHKTIALNQDYDVISERCCESSLRVFCQTLFTNKILPEGLLREFQKDFEDNDLKPTVTIYFKIPVEEAKRRIKERARFFEQDIVAEESEYLRNLEKEYDLIYGADRPDVVPIEAAVPEGPVGDMRSAVVEALETNRTRLTRHLEDQKFESPHRELDKIISWFRKRNTASSC